eukprot:4136709-Lingulodinium_polyedra.AAC.1
MSRNGTSVVRLNHGGDLIRGAEHLRYPTDAERALFGHKTTRYLDLLTDLLRGGQGAQVEDLGPPPTPEQRNAAEGDDGPNDTP